MLTNSPLFPNKVKLPAMIALTVLFGLILTVFPLPIWANLLRPQWMALLLFYWVLELPNKIGIFWAWVIGLLLDSLFDVPFGIFAMSLVLISYLTVSLQVRFEIFSFGQKLAIIYGLMLLYQLPYYIFEFCVGNTFSIWSLLLPPAVSAIIWPYFAFFMHNWCGNLYTKDIGVI